AARRGHLRLKFGFGSEARLHCPGKAFNPPETGVVPRLFVFASRIAEADDEAERMRHGISSDWPRAGAKQQKAPPRQAPAGPSRTRGAYFLSSFLAGALSAPFSAGFSPPFSADLSPGLAPS